MQIGDIVKPCDGGDGNRLHCGSGWYDDAVVIALDPLVLVSRSSEMRWQHTIQQRRFEVTGTADEELLQRCMRRLNK